MKDETNNLLFEATSDENILRREKDKKNAILEKLHVEFGIPRADLEAMLEGEHFNHQY